MRGFRLAIRAATLTLLLIPSPARATVSLDGSNCILFAGARPERELAQCVTFTSQKHTLTVSLYGKAPDNVTRIALSRDGLPPFQSLSINAHPLISLTDIGLLLTDMNFDGHIDLGLMRTGNTQDHRPFLYFMFDPAAGRFVSSEPLQLLGRAKFDADRKRVISTWRERGRRGTDAFEWRNDELRLVERTLREQKPRSCKRLIYTWAGNRRTASEHACETR